MTREEHRIPGAKTPRRGLRPEYWTDPDRSRDPPTEAEEKAMAGRPGAKIWRKARWGKL